MQQDNLSELQSIMKANEATKKRLTDMRLPVQTAYDVISRGSAVQELHRARMGEFVVGAWTTAGKVDQELRRVMEDPSWVERCSPKDLAVMHSSLVRTAAIVGDALNRTVPVVPIEQVDAEEDIRLAALTYVADTCGISLTDLNAALTGMNPA